MKEQEWQNNMPKEWIREKEENQSMVWIFS